MAAFKIISSLFNVILPPGYNFFCRTILDALKGNGVARLHERKPLGNGDRSGVNAVGAVIGQREIVVGVTGNDDILDRLDRAGDSFACRWFLGSRFFDFLLSQRLTVIALRLIDCLSGADDLVLRDIDERIHFHKPCSIFQGNEICRSPGNI